MLLYEESGTFSTSQGLKLSTSKQYLWKFSLETRQIELFFVVRDSNPPRIDYPFLSMSLDDHLQGKDTHECGQDTYQATFDLGALQTSEEAHRNFKIIYDVSGPRKDYTSTTVYTAS